MLLVRLPVNSRLLVWGSQFTGIGIFDWGWGVVGTTNPQIVRGSVVCIIVELLLTFKH